MWATNNLDLDHEPSGGSQRIKREEPICHGAINEKDEMAFASLVNQSASRASSFGESRLPRLEISKLLITHHGSWAIREMQHGFRCSAMPSAAHPWISLVIVGWNVLAEHFIDRSFMKCLGM